MNEPEEIQGKPQGARGRPAQAESKPAQAEGTPLKRAEPATRPLFEPSIAHIRIIATLVAVVALLVAVFMRCG